jgi:hypothetical protein
LQHRQRSGRREQPDQVPTSSPGWASAVAVALLAVSASQPLVKRTADVVDVGLELFEASDQRLDLSRIDIDRILTLQVRKDSLFRAEAAAKQGNVGGAIWHPLGDRAVT